MGEGTASRPALHVAAKGGLAVAFHGPLGPAVARFEQWSRERPMFARTLGVAGASLPVVPALWVDGDALSAFWCEEDGAHAMRIEPDGAHGEKRMLVPGARAIAVTGGKGRATLFAADEAGIVRLDVDAGLAPIGEARRCVSERRAGAILAATRLREHALLAFAHRGAPGFGVVLAREGDEIVVRHEVAARNKALVQGHGSDFVEDVDVRAAGGRAAIALELLGGKVFTGEIGPDGQLVERPHRLLAREGARLGSPQVVWTEDSFSALVHDREADRLRVEPLGEKGERFVLPRCEGPFEATFTRQHFFVLEAVPTEDGARLSLWRVKRTGKEAQQRVFEVTLDDRELRKKQLALRHVLSSLSARVEQAHGYRDRGTRASMAHDGSRIDLADEVGRLSLGFTFADGGDYLARVTSELGADSALPEATSSLVRLARRVRGWIWRSAPELSEAERAWATDLSTRLGAGLVRFERAGTVVIVELALATLPHAEVFERWLRELRKEQTERFGPQPASE